MVEALKNDRETRFKDTDDRHILIGAAGSNLDRRRGCGMETDACRRISELLCILRIRFHSVSDVISGRRDMEWVSVFVRKIMTTNNVYNTPPGRHLDMLPHIGQ